MRARCFPGSGPELISQNILVPSRGFEPGSVPVARPIRTVRRGTGARPMSVPEAMPNYLRPASVVALALLVAACTRIRQFERSIRPAGRPAERLADRTPTGSPADVGALEHPTGATDIVLRYDVGGGFMIAGFAAVAGADLHAVRRRDGRLPEHDPGAAARPGQRHRAAIRSGSRSSARRRSRTCSSSPSANGGLGAAREQYDNPMITDVGTTTFTIDAGGVKKDVNIYALGMETEGVPDMPARRAFNELATRLSDFDQGGAIVTDVYAPTAYRGILMDGTGMVDPGVIAWPWTDIAPTDFKGPADPNAFQLAHADADARGGRRARRSTDPEGGFQGLLISGPDGKRTRSRCGRCCRTRPA